MAAGSVTVPPSYLPSQQNSLNATLGWLTGQMGQQMPSYPGSLSVYPSTQMNQGLGALSQFMQPSQQQNAMQGLANRATQFGQGMQPYWSNPQVVQDYYQQNVVNPSQYQLYENTLPQIRGQFAAPGGPGYSSSFQQQAMVDAITQSQIANNAKLADLMYQERGRDIQGEQAAWDRGQQGFTQQNQLRNIPLEQATAGINLGSIPMQFQERNAEREYNAWNATQPQNQQQLLSLLGQLTTSPMNQGYTVEGANPWMQTAGLGANVLGTALGSGGLQSILSYLFPQTQTQNTGNRPPQVYGGTNQSGGTLPSMNLGNLTNWLGLGNTTSLDPSTWLDYSNPNNATNWLGGDVTSSIGDFGGGLDVNPFTQTGGQDLIGDVAGQTFDAGQGLFSSAGDIVNLGGDVTSSALDSASGSIPWLGLAKAAYGLGTNGLESLVSPSTITLASSLASSLGGGAGAAGMAGAGAGLGALSATGVGALMAAALATFIGFGNANWGGTGYSINPTTDENRGLMVNGAGGQPGVTMGAEQQFANTIDNKVLVERFKQQYGFDPSTMAANDPKIRGVVAWFERQPEVQQAQQGYQKWLSDNYVWQSKSSEGEQDEYVKRDSVPNWFDPNYMEVGGGV